MKRLRKRDWCLGALAAALRHLAYAGFLAFPIADACTVHTPRMRYVNLVELNGPKIEGLKWVQIYNILDYEGNERIVVSGIRGRERFPVAKWENGSVCAYDREGLETCEPKRAFTGIPLEGYFGAWQAASNRMQDLESLRMKLILERADGQEVTLTLRSRVVRNNRKLYAEQLERASNIVCAELNSEKY